MQTVGTEALFAALYVIDCYIDEDYERLRVVWIALVKNYDLETADAALREADSLTTDRSGTPALELYEGVCGHLGNAGLPLLDAV